MAAPEDARAHPPSLLRAPQRCRRSRALARFLDHLALGSCLGAGSAPHRSDQLPEARRGEERGEAQVRDLSKLSDEQLQARIESLSEKLNATLYELHSRDRALIYGGQ